VKIPAAEAAHPSEVSATIDLGHITAIRKAPKKPGGAWSSELKSGLGIKNTAQKKS